MNRLIEAIWPYLSRETADQVRERTESRQSDVASLAAASWKEPLLEEARNLAAQENDRRRAAETKASIYLAVMAAIIPVLSSLVTDFYGDESVESSMAFRVVTLALLVIGLLYLLGSGIWAFRTLAVAVHYRVDVPELLAVNEEKKPRSALTLEILKATRLNWDGVNEKTNCIRMAHEFLIRTFFSFAALILTIVLWKPVGILLYAGAGWGMSLISAISSPAS